MTTRNGLWIAGLRWFHVEHFPTMILASSMSVPAFRQYSRRWFHVERLILFGFIMFDIHLAASAAALIPIQGLQSK